LNRVLRVLRGEDGQSLAEYALIGALIAVVAITMLTGLGQAIVEKIRTIKDTISNAQPTP